MPSFAVRLRSFWSTLPPSLRRLTVGSLALLAATLLLQLVDGRQVMGVSTWMKPAKFAGAVGITGFTLAVLLRHLVVPGAGLRRALRVITWLSAYELLVMTFQAARGVPSHFNHRTLFDTVVYQSAGAAIVAVTIAFIYLAVQAFRQPFADRALGWGIRLGLVAFLLGSSVGGMMPGPTAAQLQALKAGQVTPMLGAHAVGVPDGGPGLPVTGWSTEGGDLRIPHFVGLHGLQLLPLAAWLLGRRRDRQLARGQGPTQAAARAAALTVTSGLAYLALVAGLLIQALRGQPLLAPDRAGGLLFAAIALGALLAATFISWKPLALAGSTHTQQRRSTAPPIWPEKVA